MVPLLPISDGLADQLLQPLLGYCMGHTVDIWKYSLCVGAFSRQEMTVGAADKLEFYSLGVNDRLEKAQIDKLRIQLENGKETTEEIAAGVFKKPFDASQEAETIIDAFIERSRKSTYERFVIKVAERK